ncbi:cold shock protein (beta-ribbon, CspA family) [Pedobacter antarcticus]|nr:cold shock protein (beta-ribbon, CspA family) [Pedobacter antarcticus]SFF00876.1 cold shock protein (beta-ribbon, CspA family) [Pedobacter antarcticus]
MNNNLYIRAIFNNNTMQEGVVKFFNETKGFGFIVPSNGDSEIFVHSTGLLASIRENDKVTYDVEEGRKGLNAINVQLV